MANNPYVNKVTFGNNTIMDITDTSAGAGDVIEGEVFYNSTGARTVGTLGDATQSAHGLMSVLDKIKLDSLQSFTCEDYEVEVETTDWNNGVYTWEDDAITETCYVVVSLQHADDIVGGLSYDKVEGGVEITVDNEPTEDVTFIITVLDAVSSYQSGIAEETDPTIAEWAKAAQKPTYTAQEVGALPADTVIPTVPTNVSAFTNDAGYLTAHQDISGKANSSDLAAVATSGDYDDLINKPTIPTVPTTVSSFTNDAGYLTSHQDISGKANSADLATVATSGDYDDLINKPTIPTVPTNVSSFTNDAGYLTAHQDISGKANSADLATVATSGDYTDLINTPTIPTVPTTVSSFTNDAGYLTSVSNMTGATSSAAGAAGLVPAPTTADTDKFLRGDGTWQDGGKPMVILSYGASTWNDFITAYNNNVIVYCRASSNSNPASGTQGRMAFMAYLNNDTTPTEVEFQYYRSVNPNQKSATQMSDQVFVYKLTSSGTWSVITREASLKQVIAGTNITTSYSNNQLTINAPTNVSAFTNDAGYLTAHQDITGKVDKVTGKDLSTNDFTDAYKAILDNIATTSETQAIISEYGVSV